MNAPEQCPVCGAAKREAWPPKDGYGLTIKFDCHALWMDKQKEPWVRGCDYAFDACLRTGATLTATPLEQAEKALVAAAQEWHADPPAEPTTTKLIFAVAAYRAALDGAK